MPNIGDLILWYVVFVFSLTLHEVGHAWTSELFGDDTGRYEGRISLNPLVHMDTFGTVIFPIFGALTGLPLFGWAKPVPVNPLRWKDKVKANIAVSAAGPIANILIAIGALIIIKVLIMQNHIVPGYGGFWGFVEAANPNTIFVPIAKMLCIAVTTNFALAIFNMLPIPPLDGSHIFSSILSVVSPEMMDSYDNLRNYGFFILIGFFLIDGLLGLNLILRAMVVMFHIAKLVLF